MATLKTLKITEKFEDSLRIEFFSSLYFSIQFDSGGIRTHATEVTGALNQRLRPLGHAILPLFEKNV